MSPLDVLARQALSQEDSPYGTVGVLHAGPELEAWWIWKDGEEVEPVLSVLDRDDLLYVVHGSLGLELEGADPVVLCAGELFVSNLRRFVAGEPLVNQVDFQRGY